MIAKNYDSEGQVSFFVWFCFAFLAVSSALQKKNK